MAKKKVTEWLINYNTGQTGILTDTQMAQLASMIERLTEMPSAIAKLTVSDLESVVLCSEAIAKANEQGNPQRVAHDPLTGITVERIVKKK